MCLVGWDLRAQSDADPNKSPDPADLNRLDCIKADCWALAEVCYLLRGIQAALKLTFKTLTSLITECLDTFNLIE